MARLRSAPLASQASTCQNLDHDVDSEATPDRRATRTFSRYDWGKVLASGDDCASEKEVDINRAILQRLKDCRAPQHEVLASLLDSHLEQIADADLWVLCTVSIAHQLGLIERIVTPQKQAIVRSCIDRTQPKRPRLNNKRAEALLKAKWGGWDGLTRQNKLNEPRVVVELAKLCRLGVEKEEAETLLQNQIDQRRTGKKSVPNKESPTLRQADVAKAIEQFTAQLRSAKAKKRKRVEDSAYSGPRGKRPALQAVTPSRYPLEHSSNSADPEPEVEGGRGRTANLSDIEDPSSFFLDGLDSSISSERRHSTAPSSPPVMPSSPCKPCGESPKDQLSNNTLEHSFTPKRLSVENDDDDFDLCRNEPKSHGLHLPPPISKENMLHDTEHPEPNGEVSPQARISEQPSNVNSQALQELKDGQKINASVVNAVLGKIVSTPDTLLVDSNELAKFDYTSQWNAHCAQGTDLVESPAPEHRRSRAVSASRLIMPFHQTCKEHWSLFVASRREEAYVIEHYDSLQNKGQGNPLDADQAIVRRYFDWLVSGTVQLLQVISKSCALQRDGASCGIHLLANVEAIAENRDVPMSIDTVALRLKYWNLLQPAVQRPSMSTSLLPTNLIRSIPPLALTVRAPADTSTEHAMDEVPTDGNSQPPPMHDGTGHVPTENDAMASPLRFDVTVHTGTDATSQATAGGAIATASPSDISADQNSSPVFPSATDVSTQPPKTNSILDTLSDQSNSASSGETDQPNLKSVQQKQRLQAQAGHTYWNDLFEAARRDLGHLESQASELQRHRQEAFDKQELARTRASVAQENLENLNNIPWKTLPEGSSSCYDEEGPSLEDFRAQIRQHVATAREEIDRLGQEIEMYDTRRRALEEPIERAQELVKDYQKKEESWQSYVKHLDSFMW